MRTYTSKKIGNSAFLTCKAAADEPIDTVVLGMLANNRINGILPVTIQQLDQEWRLQFDITEKLTLDDCLTGTLGREKALELLEQTAEIVVGLQDYMIDEKYIVFDNKYIYLDAGREHIFLLCLPLEEEGEMTFAQYCSSQFEIFDFRRIFSEERYNRLNTYLKSRSFDASMFAEMIKKELVLSATESGDSSRSVEPVILERSDSVKHREYTVHRERELHRESSVSSSVGAVVLNRGGNYPSDIPDGTILSDHLGCSCGSDPRQTSENEGAVELKRAYADNREAIGETVFMPEKDHGLHEEVTASTGNQYFLPEDETVYLQPESTSVHGYLWRQSTQEKVEVTGTEFRIGKSQQAVDYRIEGNPTISRNHARITRKGDNFFIEDTNSKNHTYVNKKMIDSNQEVPLSDGTAICFANEEFVFLICR